MLTAIFHTIVEMNITVSAIAALLLLVKFILQKLGFPRRVLFLLWIVIAFRLACPISISTDFSPLNLATAFQQDAAVQQAPAAPPLLPEAMPASRPGLRQPPKRTCGKSAPIFGPPACGACCCLAPSPIFC